MNSPAFAAVRQGAPHFADLGAVQAALLRMGNDFMDLAAEAGEAVKAVRFAMQPSGDKERARRALKNQQAQLVWLAAESGAMLAALADDGGVAMPNKPIAKREISNPVSHLYSLAEALLYLGMNQPESQAGLAMLLCIIGEEVKESASVLDDAGE